MYTVKNFLVTGRPGIGKTTCIMRIVSLLREKGRSVDGFITREERRGNRRVGFKIVSLGDNKEDYLASIWFRDGPRVSKYVVNLKALESIGVKAIIRALEASDVIVIDEIGPMELFSSIFQDEVLKALDSKKAVLASIHFKASRYPFGRKIFERKDIRIYELKVANRETIYLKIARDILKTLNILSK